MLRNTLCKDQAMFHNCGATKCVVVYTLNHRVSPVRYKRSSVDLHPNTKKLPAALDCNILLVMKYNPVRWLATQAFPPEDFRTEIASEEPKETVKVLAIVTVWDRRR